MKEYIVEAINKEKQALDALTSMAFDECNEITHIIDECKGKIVFTGVGKSAHIGKKLAATYASLGICSIFVHATESMHGALGMIDSKDVVIMISNSGNTQEVVQMIEPVRTIGAPVSYTHLSS